MNTFNINVIPISAAQAICHIMMNQMMETIL